MSRRPRVVLALAFAMLVGACADGDGDGEGADRAPPVTSPSTTSTEPPGPDHRVEVATINVLHGLPVASGCVVESDQCLAPTRAGIIWHHLETAAGCPEIIALQEISPRWFEIVPEMLPALCDGNHALLADDVGSPDQEMILTTLPVLEHERVALAGTPVWSAHWAQLDAGDGLVVDVFATHYASSAFNPPCGDDPATFGCGERCPPDMSLGECHPLQTLDFLAERAAPGSLQLVIGDLNKEIDHPRILTLLDAGFVDTHLLAGLGPCVEGSNDNCTSGIGGDTELDGLDLADQTLTSRIDMILVRPPEGCEAGVDADDADGDGTSTGIWADEPLPEPVEGLYWAADHAGIQADIGLTCA